MTLVAWIRKALGYSDPPENAAVIEKIEREKERLNGAQAALSEEVDAIKSQRKRGAIIFGLLDDALRTLDKGDLR